jgi:molybdopterin/thiamine biosynthesis adenylyltransferase
MDHPAHLAYVGLGNIGSHAMPGVARLAGRASVLVIDRDAYDAGNLVGQDIRPRDVGRLKAHVQARRLRALCPGVAVEALALPLEHVPLGRLAGAVLLTGLDSLAARQTANRVALRLGLPWIDAGVNPDAGLVRVSLVHGGAGGPCYECGWDEREYRALEHEKPCALDPAGGSGVAPTRASAQLGALAASLQLLETERLLRDGSAAGQFGRHTVFDERRQRVVVSDWRRYEGCRVADHAPWTIERLTHDPRALTLADALDLAPPQAHGRCLTVPGVRFVAALTCLRCGVRRPRLRLSAALGPRARACRTCGGPLRAVGGDLLEGLDGARLPRRVLRRSLAGLGLRPHEVFGVGDGQATRRFVLAARGAREACAGRVRGRSVEPPAVGRDEE